MSQLLLAATEDRPSPGMQSTQPDSSPDGWPRRAGGRGVTADDLRRLLRRRPFQAFTLSLADGRRFEAVSGVHAVPGGRQAL